MTMIDEDELTAALATLANDFAVSDAAAQRILVAATESGGTVRAIQWPSIVRRGRARSILVAAALVVTVGAISIPLLRQEGSPSRFAAVHGPASLVTKNNGSSVITSSNAQDTAGASKSATRLGIAGVTTGSGASVGPKVESSGSVHLTVGKDEVQGALANLSRLATLDGGYVLSSQANSSSAGSGNFSTATIVLQVPQQRFSSLITQVQRDGEATSIHSTSTNVTSQYVDLRARIAALEVSRHQYLAIMTRATTIGGILQVQNQLDAIQSQIEQLQGRTNVLDNATTYGTLTVKLSASGQSTSGPNHRSGIAAAWHDSIGGFVGGFEWLIRIAGPALFVALLVGTALVIGRTAWRAARRRQM